MNKTQEFGPYDSFPIAHIDYSDNSTLRRTLTEDIPDDESVREELDWKKWVKYFLFLYAQKESVPKGLGYRFVGVESLVSDVSGFRIEEKDGKYFIVASLRSNSEDQK